MRSREEVGLLIPRHIVDIPVMIKTFKFSITSNFYWLADDANKHHNYIQYLFILQTAHSDSSFHYLNCVLQQKLKNSNLILAQTGSELPNFLKTGKYLLMYSFMLHHFQKSSKSKLSDKRLDKIGVTALKKKFLWKLSNIALVYHLVYHHAMSFITRIRFHNCC